MLCENLESCISGTFAQYFYEYTSSLPGFSGGAVVKNLPANVGDSNSIPRLGRSPGGGNGNPLQYSCLGNPMDRGASEATVPGVTRSQT